MNVATWQWLLTIGIAVVQAAHDGYYPLAAFITTIGTLSYTAPAWLRRWEHIKTTYGHHALAAAHREGPGPQTLLIVDAHPVPPRRFSTHRSPPMPDPSC